jgi:chemotaxis family two-component system response regulator Rcp1
MKPRAPTALLVEDNEMDVFVIREVLDQCGLDVRLRVARDGQEALQYLQDLNEDVKSACPVLVLLDLNLPKVSGIEVLTQLRSATRYDRTLVIVISSSNSESDREAAQRLRADAYFRKPADLAAYMELAQVIKHLLPTSQAGNAGA